MVNMKSSILNKEIQYTPEEISLIKKNLKEAFGQEYLYFYLDVENIKKHIPNFKIQVGDTFAYYNAFESGAFGMKKIGWHKIKITYTRGDAVFFTIDKNKKEHYFDVDSHFCYKLILLNVDYKRLGIPEKNLQLLKFNKSNCPFKIKIIK